jgi:hypothetical protein
MVTSMVRLAVPSAEVTVSVSCTIASPSSACTRLEPLASA